MVITDMNMPDMDGLDLSRELRRIKVNIPIILCTGFSGLDIIKKAKETAVNEIIIKPFLVQDLAKTIHKFIN